MLRRVVDTKHNGDFWVEAALVGASVKANTVNARVEPCTSRDEALNPSVRIREGFAQELPITQVLGL
jgi:hypothetical protein